MCRCSLNNYLKAAKFLKVCFEKAIVFEKIITLKINKYKNLIKLKLKNVKMITINGLIFCKIRFICNDTILYQN